MSFSWKLFFHLSIELENIPVQLATISPVILLLGWVFFIILGILVIFLAFYFGNRLQRARAQQANGLAYRQVLEASQFATWEWHIEKSLFTTSPLFAEWLGYSSNELGQRKSDWDQLIHPEDRDHLDEQLKQHFEGKREYFKHEHRILSKNGEWRWLQARGKVVEWTADHRPIRMIGTYSAGFEQPRTGEALQRIIQPPIQVPGSDYFQRLALDLGSVLQVRWASISLVDERAENQLQMVCACLDGCLVTRPEFGMDGALSVQPVVGSSKVIPDLVQELHPNDNDLPRLGARSYVGLSLTGQDGRNLGNLVVIDDRPLDNPQFVENVLSMYAGWAALAVERMQVNRELQQSENRWKFALEVTGDCLWDLDLLTNRMVFSATFKDMLGYSDQEIPDRLETWINLVHPEDLSFVLQEHERYLRGETDVLYEEYRLKCKDGYYKWILGRGKAVRSNEDGKPLRLIGVCTDITLHKASEQVMHETMAKYQSLFESMTEGFAYHKLVLDESGKARDYIVLDVNPAYSKHLAIARQDAIGARASSLYGTDPAPFLEEYSRVALTGVPDHLEVFFPPMNKTFFIAVFSPEYGKFATVFSDVSEHKKAETIIAHERNLLRTLIDNLPDAIYAKDLSYRKTLANKADVVNAGFSSEDQVLGKNDFDVWPHELAARFHEHDRYVLETGLPLINREEIISPPGQAPRWILSSKIPLFDPEGKISGLVGMGRDITEIKLADREIRRLNAELEQRVAERTAQLEAVIKELETFSYSVSHDLRAPLRIVDGFSQVLTDEFHASMSETGRNYLARIREASKRMGQLIEDLLELSRISRSELRLEEVNLSLVAEDVKSELLAAQPDRCVDWVIPPMIMANGDANFLRIVLSNLMGNSWKFSSRKADARIEIGANEIEGQRVYFVKDNGAGFDMAHASKLFVPFQRIHNSSEFEGTGIGLATVQRVIFRHGGKVWAESSPGSGTTVFFTLGNLE